MRKYFYFFMFFFAIYACYFMPLNILMDYGWKEEKNSEEKFRNLIEKGLV